MCAIVRATLLRVLVLLSFTCDAGLGFDFALVIGISFGLCGDHRRHQPKPHLSKEAGGAGSRSVTSARSWTEYRSVRTKKPVLSG